MEPNIQSYHVQQSNCQIFKTVFSKWSFDAIQDDVFALFRYAIQGGFECNSKPVEDIALLLDQLMELVAAAYALHQSGGADLLLSPLPDREGEVHD